MTRFLSCQTSGVRVSLDWLEPGDHVLVDPRFHISGIVPPGVTVNMPQFLAGCDQLTAAETEERMSIASVLIHVECAIGRVKSECS